MTGVHLRMWSGDKSCEISAGVGGDLGMRLDSRTNCIYEEELNAGFIIHNYKEACGVTGCMVITIDTNLIIAGADSFPPRLHCSFIFRIIMQLVCEDRLHTTDSSLMVERRHDAR